MVALEVRHHLNHPVDHAATQRRCNFVPHQAIICGVAKFKLHQVCEMLFAKVFHHVYVLPLNFRGLPPT